MSSLHSPKRLYARNNTCCIFAPTGKQQRNNVGTESYSLRDQLGSVPMSSFVKSQKKGDTNMALEFRRFYILANAFLFAFIALWSSLAFGDIQVYTEKTSDNKCSKTLASNTRDVEGDPAIPSLFKKDESAYEITLYYYEDEVSRVAFNETSRDTVLLTQLKELASAVSKKAAAELKAPPSHICIQASPYRLKFKRANLKIVATGIDGKSEQSFNIVTGPEEHWYLGFDLPVINHKTLKYDQTTKSLSPQDQNPQLYLSFNYSTSDVVSTVKNRWSLKLLLQASSRPLDSVGLGVGYRLPEDIFGDQLSSFTVFAGRFWTKQDAMTAGGDGLLNQSTGKDWRFGITYDFSTGLPWIK